MIRVGITGDTGFIGYHLKHYLGLFRDEFSIAEFDRSWFDDTGKLLEFVSSCDAIIHLAGVNRHKDQDYIRNENVRLAELLSGALLESNSDTYVLFASSIQEGNGSPYAIGKEKARTILAGTAESLSLPFLGLILPNVFGPFSKPYYNSVVATFSHQLEQGEKPHIIQDNNLDLLYVNDLCDHILRALKGRQHVAEFRVVPTGVMTVRGLLEKLRGFHQSYRERFEIPGLEDPLDIALFNTYRSYIEAAEFPFELEKHSDDRGSLAEVVRSVSGGQVFYSVTKAGITRGNHFHRRKVERFCVLSGEATIRLRRIGRSEVTEIKVNGEQPAVVDMPVWYTHNITNTGKGELLTLFWSSEFYNPEDADTWYEAV